MALAKQECYLARFCAIYRLSAVAYSSHTQIAPQILQVKTEWRNTLYEHPVPVSTGMSDMTMPTEDGNEDVIPDPEHVSIRESNVIVAARDPVLPLTDVYTPSTCFSGRNTWAQGRSYRDALRSTLSLAHCLAQSTNIDARRVTVDQDPFPMVALAAKARHSEIIGQLSMTWSIRSSSGKCTMTNFQKFPG